MVHVIALLIFQICIYIGVVNVLLTGTPVSPIEYKCPILHQKVMVAENSSSKHNIEYYLNKWQHQINEYIPRYNDNEYIIKWDAANNVAIVLNKNQEENTLHKTDDTKMGNNITRRINTHFYNKKTRHANVMFKIDCRDVDVVRAQYVVFRLLDDDIRKYIAYISNQEVSNECSIEKDGKLTAVTCSVTSTQRIPKLEGNEITTETQLSKTVEKDYNSNSVGNPDKFLAKSSGEVKQLVVVKHQECCIVM